MNTSKNKTPNSLVNELAKQEMDEPLKELREFKSNHILENSEKKIDKDLFNRVKGHNLLGWCVFILVTIYGIEKCTGGDVSQIAESIIEIIKLLIFSLTGFLFGKHGRDN